MPTYPLAKTILPIESIQSLSLSQQQAMLSIFQEFGFVILDSKPTDDPETDFVALSRYYGKVIPHNQSDNLGILPITVLPDYPEYANSNNLDLALHTDGTFEKIPPKVMAMHCKVAARYGGLSLLVDGQVLYEHLATVNPVGLQQLFEPDIFSVSRDNQTATRSILEVHGDRIHIAFRSDTVARVSIDPRIVETFETIKAFLADPHNQISFKLQPHQILIFDNTRMLHGRTGFPLTEKRRINGLWFDGKGNFSNPLSFGILPSPSSQKVRQVALTKG